MTRQTAHCQVCGRIIGPGDGDIRWAGGGAVVPAPHPIGFPIPVMSTWSGEGGSCPGSGKPPTFTTRTL